MFDVASVSKQTGTGGPRGAAAPRAVAVGFTGVVAVLVAATEWGQYIGRSGAGYTALDLVVAIATVALVPVLGRWPALGGFALAALASLSACATPGATAATLHVAQRRSLAMAISVGTASAACHVVRGLWRPIAGLPMVWWLVLIVSCHAALIAVGALGQSRRALLNSLRDRARRAEAEQERRVLVARTEERRQIAWEMHDVLAHRLSLVATYAGAIEYRPDAAPERLSQAAGVIRAGAHQALEELRDVIAVLREDVAQDDDAPQPTLADLPALLDESRAVGCEVDFRGAVAELGVLPVRATRTGYRVVQEGLTNARKHATGQLVTVTVTREDNDLVVEVRNELCRIPATGSPPGAGMGLIGLSERVRLAGGELEHHRAGGDFMLRASIPC